MLISASKTCKNVQKYGKWDFDQWLEWSAPESWSKYTTFMRSFNVDHLLGVFLKLLKLAAFSPFFEWRIISEHFFEFLYFLCFCLNVCFAFFWDKIWDKSHLSYICSLAILCLGQTVKTVVSNTLLPKADDKTCLIVSLSDLKHKT